MQNAREINKAVKANERTFFKALLNDKDFEEPMFRIPFHFTLRMAATIIIVTITVMIVDIPFTGIIFSRNFEFRMGELVGDVGLFFEIGPFITMMLAVFFTVELIRQKRKKASAKTKTEANADT